MLEDLSTKKMPELRSIAKQMGLGGVKAESAQALRLRITLAAQPGLMDKLNQNPTLSDKPKQVTDIQIKPKWLTAQDVVEALRPYQARLQLAFYDKDNNPSSANAHTWMVKNAQAEDSGSMTMPIELIRRKAEMIYNARFPAKLGKDAGDLSGALSV